MTFFQKARSFFLGLVLGEFSIAVFYVLLNMFGAWMAPTPRFRRPRSRGGEAPPASA